MHLNGAKRLLVFRNNLISLHLNLKIHYSEKSLVFMRKI